MGNADDLWQLKARKHTQMYNNSHNKSINDFKYQRKKAEKSITDHIPNIDDIYESLSNIYSKTECDDLKQLE